MHTRAAQHAFRWMALPLLFCYLWLSSAGQLMHADDLREFQTAPTTVSTVHPTLPAAEIDSCAACEWSQAVHSSPFFIASFVSPTSLLTVHSPVLFAVLHLDPFRHTTPRAPPVFS